MSLSAGCLEGVRADWGGCGTDLGAIGVELFITMFQRQDNLLTYFPKLAGKSIDVLRTDANLKEHATKVVSLLNVLVKNADNEAELKSQVEKFAKQHRARKVDPDMVETIFPDIITVVKAHGGTHEDEWKQFLKAFNDLNRSMY
ncbi:hypothetical protein ScPMuIL_017783 [Solemya velum]